MSTMYNVFGNVYLEQRKKILIFEEVYQIFSNFYFPDPLKKMLVESIKSQIRHNLNLCNFY